MNFKQYVKTAPILKADPFAFINLVLLVATFLYIIPLTSGKPILQVALPKAITSDMLNAKDVTVVVTGENLLYIDNKVTTLQELKALFTSKKVSGIFIKVDRRSSVGRIVDVWNVARASGVKRVNVASDQE